MFCASLRRGPVRLVFASVAAALALVAAPVVRGATLLTWNITGTTGSSSGGAASVQVLGVSGSAMTGGGTTGNSTSPSGTWNRAFALVADAATAQSGTNYFSWTTTADAGYTVAITGITGLNLSRTTSGPTSAELWYSTDGTTFTKTGSTFTVGATLASPAAAFSETMAVTPIVIVGGASSSKTVTWRLVVYGGTAASRLGIGNADAANDFAMIGTVTGGATRDLVWGGGDGAWNTVSTNKPWTFSGAASAFVANDNVTIGSAGTLTVDAAGVSTGSVAVTHSSGNVTLNGGSLTGTTFAKSGAGTLFLKAANTFSGGATIAGGVTQIDVAGCLGSQSVTVDGGALRFVDPSVTTFANSLAVANGDAVIEVGTGVTITDSGVVSSTGTTGGVGVNKGDAQTFNTLRKTGAGKLALTANLGAQMSYTTGTSAGVTTTGGVALQIDAGLLEISNNRTWNLASGVDLDAVDSITGQVTSVYNGMVWNGDLLMRGGKIQINGGNVRGTGTITVGVVGETAAVNTLGQRLNFNSPDISNAVVINSGHTLTLDSQSGGAIALLGALSGSGTITTSGNGTARVIPSVAVTFNGTFNAAGKMELSAQALAAASQVVTANVLTLSNKASTSGAVVATPISGTGSLFKSGDGDVVLTGNNTFTGGISLGAAGAILVESVSGLGTGAITAAHSGAKIGLAATGASPLVIPNTLGTGTTDAVNAFFPVLAFTPGTGRVISLTGAISGTGQLKVSGGGDLDLTAQTTVTNTNAGGIELGTGRILASGDDNLGSGAINFGTISGSTLVASGSSANVTFSRDITIGSASTSGFAAQIDTNGKTVTLSGSVSDKAGNARGGSVVKLGAGELVLTGVLSYGGDTTVQQGILALGSANAANDASTVTIATGSALRLSFTGTDTVAALYIGGVQQPAGVYGSSHSSGAFLGAGTLTVTSGPTPVDAYATWTASFGLAGDQALQSADPDADGLSNLLEYALGTSPVVTGASPITAARSGNFLTFTYGRIADPALTYTVEGADDLAGPWSVVAVAGNPSTGAANGAGSVTVTDTASLATKSRRFLRLTVTR